MSRLLITSDLHLGHRNILKYRQGFNSLEEHNEVLFDNLASTVSKSDTLYLLGDVAFDKHWLSKVSAIKCKHKKLICGNHDRDYHTMSELCEAFDSVDSLLSKRNVWWSHCPIHPQELRGRHFNIHGHLHNSLVYREEEVRVEDLYGFESIKTNVIDKRFFNVCVEHTRFKPITFEEVRERMS